MGYKFSVYDMPPQFFELMARANVLFDNYDYVENVQTQGEMADTETIQL
jgi:hypothetical protein